MNNNLLEYSNNIFSQNGEDGLVKEILKRISLNHRLDRWCAEFGAWDGVLLSNTCNLIKEQNYNAVLIEGDKDKFKDLKKNFPSDEVTKICKFINFDGENTLDKVLSKTLIPKDFDFLSIDVDGIDYYIFESLNKYNPKVICIEFNPTIPNFVNYVQLKDINVKQGSSAKSIKELAERKGYKLVSIAGCNLILVKEKYFYSVLENIPNLEDLFPIGNQPTCIFVGYDGTILSNKDSFSLPWHKISVPIYSFQILPRLLRQFRGDYGFIKKIIFKICKFFYYSTILIFFPKESFYLLKKRNVFKRFKHKIFRDK